VSYPLPPPAARYGGPEAPKCAWIVLGVRARRLTRDVSAEIDRTLKKVAEGVEVFESNYDKLQASTNQTQKEKLETELKTQIKKLQRLRDQIKTWVASNDIKDKSSLLDNRRLIETVNTRPPARPPRVMLVRGLLSACTDRVSCMSALRPRLSSAVRCRRYLPLPIPRAQQMEKFKACEKEMKTKAFSKEGLIASAKIDPKVIEQEETMAWVQEKVEALQQQVELTEAEIEALQGGGKKKKASSAAERLEQLEHLNERRRWHISRLEIILRLLDNGSLKADKIKLLTEDVSYFVESNAACTFLPCASELTDTSLRRTSSTKMRASTMNSTSTSKRSSGVSTPRTTMARQRTPKWRLKVRLRAGPTTLTYTMQKPLNERRLRSTKRSGIRTDVKRNRLQVPC
jgi:CCR4-NOT transcriptional regulation complex NOT5 subunit